MKAKRFLALLLTVIMLIGVMPMTVFAYLSENPLDKLPPVDISKTDYTLPVGVTMRPLTEQGVHEFGEKSNLGNDMLFVIKKGGRYYAMKDVASDNEPYAYIPAVDVTDWINEDGTLTVPADTRDVAFWRYEKRYDYTFGMFINGSDKYLSYTYDYESVDGDNNYDNDRERIYTANFLVNRFEENEGVHQAYYWSENFVSGTLRFGGTWSYRVNYNYNYYYYTLIADLRLNSLNEQVFDFRYLGSNVRYQGDEVEGYLYYAKCRHQGDIVHAPYHAPTCLDKGCLEYWHCTLCDTYFEEKECVNAYKSKPILPALGHNYGDKDCLNCHNPIPQYTKITSYEQFVTIKPGASFIAVAEIDNGNGGKEYYVLKDPLNYVNSDIDEDGCADILQVDDDKNGTPDILEQDKDGDGIADAMAYDGAFSEDGLDGVLDEYEIQEYLFALEREYTNGYMIDARVLDSIQVKPQGDGTIVVKNMGALEFIMEPVFSNEQLGEQYYGDGATLKDYENDHIFRVPNYWLRPMVTLDNNLYGMPYDQGDSKWWGILFGKDVKELQPDHFASFPDDAAVIYTETFYSLNAEGELAHALRFLINGENKNFIITSEYYCDEIVGTQIPIYLYSSDAGGEIHEHIWGDWIAYSDDYHRRFCTVDECDAVEYATHALSEECTPDTENYELGHWVTCTVCNSQVHEYHTKESAGTYYPNYWKDTGDGVHHVVYCTKCQGPVEYAEHRWYEWYAGAKEINGEWVMGHYTKCKDWPCQAEKWQEDCLYVKTIISEPTCTEPGIISYTCRAEGCSKANKTYTEEIPPLGHDFGEWTLSGPNEETRVCQRDPSHTEKRALHECIWSPWEKDDTNDVHIRHCIDSNCTNVQSAPHTWDNGTETKAPSCTETGVKTFTCPDCKATKTEDIPALGHDFGDWTYDGTDSHVRHCKRDGCKAEEFNAHAWGEWQSVDEKTHKRVCAVCDGDLTEDHDWDNGAITKEPTCKENGIKTYTCQTCMHTKTEDIPKTDHQFGEWISNQDGKTHSRYCNCNASETAEHRFDEGKIKVEATHTSKGIKTFTCADCGYTYDEALPATPDHEWSEWTHNDNGTHTRSCRCKATETKNCEWDEGVITKQPTHFEDGVKTFTCAVCKATKTEAIAKTDAHLWSDWEHKDDKTHIRQCKCGATEIKEHSFDNGKVTKKPTHDETGVKTFTCTTCKATKTESIAKTIAHDWNNWIKKDDGLHIRRCKCGATETQDHRFDTGKITKQPTHYEEGVKTFTCTVCSYTKTERIEKTLDHEWSEWAKTDDQSHIRECKCGATETKTHAFDNGVVIKQPTHVDNGIQRLTCVDCGFTYDEIIEKTSHHTFGEWQNLATAVGKHYRECDCGEKETGDCTWDDGIITTAPTYVSEGTKTFTCTACGATKTEVLGVLVSEIVSPENSDVTITVPKGSNASLYPDTIIKVETIQNGISEETKANIAIVVGNDQADVLTSYHISLLLDGEFVQPGGTVEVTLPAPENAEDYGNLQVVYIDDDGNVTPCETRINKDGTITFVTDHFSHYAIIGVPATSPVVWILISAITVALITVAVVAVILIKKKKGIA